MSAQQLIKQSTPFLTWLANWLANLKTVPLIEAIPRPERTAMLGVDLIVGFAYQGPLSSPRVADIVPPTANLFTRAKAAGVEHYILTQDCHTDDTPEFGSFAPHCSL